MNSELTIAFFALISRMELLTDRFKIDGEPAFCFVFAPCPTIAFELRLLSESADSNLRGEVFFIAERGVIGGPARVAGDSASIASPWARVLR